MHRLCGYPNDSVAIRNLVENTGFEPVTSTLPV